MTARWILITKVLGLTVGGSLGIILVATFELITGTTNRAIVSIICLTICSVIVFLYPGLSSLIKSTNAVLASLTVAIAGIIVGPIFGLISGVIWGLLYYTGPPSYAVPITFGPFLMIYYAMIGAVIGGIGGVILWGVTKLYNHPVGWSIAGAAVIIYLGVVPFTLLPRAKLALCQPDCREKTFVWANFGYADLNGTNFTEANFYKANLKEANLRDVDLTRANLRSANLTNANLSGALLRGTELRMSDRNGAIMPAGAQ